MSDIPPNASSSESQREDCRQRHAVGASVADWLWGGNFSKCPLLRYLYTLLPGITSGTNFYSEAIRNAPPSLQAELPTSPITEYDIRVCVPRYLYVLFAPMFEALWVLGLSQKESSQVVKGVLDSASIELQAAGCSPMDLETCPPGIWDVWSSRHSKDSKHFKYAILCLIGYILTGKILDPARHSKYVDLLFGYSVLPQVQGVQGHLPPGPFLEQFCGDIRRAFAYGTVWANPDAGIGYEPEQWKTTLVYLGTKMSMASDGIYQLPETAPVLLKDLYGIGETGALFSAPDPQSGELRILSRTLRNEPSLADLAQVVDSKLAALTDQTGTSAGRFPPDWADVLVREFELSYSGIEMLAGNGGMTHGYVNRR